MILCILEYIKVKTAYSEKVTERQQAGDKGIELCKKKLNVRMYLAHGCDSAGYVWWSQQLESSVLEVSLPFHWASA